jgi:hypothetical protein
MCEIIMENQGTLVSIYSDVYFVTNLSLIPRKPTGIGVQYFLYRKVTM